MAIKVQIPPPLRESANGLAEVPVFGATVGAVLQDLIRQCPGLDSKLFDKGKLRPHINVLVNDEDSRYLEDLDTIVADGQTLALIPAVAGG